MGGHVQRPWTPTKRRGPIAAEFKGPGPAWVALPSLIGVWLSSGRKSSMSVKGTSPCFSFGCRHGDTIDYAGPGPSCYNVFGLGSKGKSSAPAASMHIRHADPKPFVTPAPCSYFPEKADKNILDASPKYSFGLKTPNEIKSLTPGPNVYKVPPVLGNCPEGNKQKAPAYTISGRGKPPVDVHAAVPGPGKYESANMNVLRNKSPSYSLSIRTTLPSDDTKKPGPGAHSPEKAEQVSSVMAPAHTFGIKHSPYTGALKNSDW